MMDSFKASEKRSDKPTVRKEMVKPVKINGVKNCRKNWLDPEGV